MRLRRRIQLLFLPFVILLLGHLFLDSYLVQERDRLRDRLDGELNPARVALSDLLGALVDQETGERGYLITGQEAFLAPYRRGKVQADKQLTDLRHLLGEDRDLLAGLQRVQSRVTAWRQLGAEFELAAKREGRNADAAALVATGTGMRLFDQARSEIEGLQLDVRTELERRQDRLDSVRDTITQVRGGAAVVGLVVVVLGRYLLSSWITRPLSVLSEAVRSVSLGQLRHPIPAIGPPELEALGRDVEGMRERLLAEIDEATTARSALAQRGMVVLALRDELTPAPVTPPAGLRVAARFQPAEGVVAGDWFDTLRDGNRFAVVLFDVSGHGPEAGVYALKTKYLVLGALRDGLTPAQALRWLAVQLGDTGDHFLTGVIVEIDASAGRLRYASAGHPPMLLVDGGEVIALWPTGPLLGPLAADWSDVEAPLPPGASLVIYSDGLTETKAADGDALGVEWLTAVLEAQGGQTDPETLADACFGGLDPVLTDARRDDITLVVVGRPSAGQDAVGAAHEVGREFDPEPGGHPGVDDDTEAGGILDGHV